MLKIDLSMRLSLRLTYKFIKSLTETNKKVHEPKTYNEAIDHLIHGNR